MTLPGRPGVILIGAVLLALVAGCADSAPRPRSGRYADICTVAELPVGSETDLMVVSDRLDPLLRSIPEGVPITRREADIMMAAHKLRSHGERARTFQGASFPAEFRSSSQELLGSPEENRAELAAACGMDGR